MKPALKNPKIIMAQVDGSGTPETGASPAGRSKAATIAPKKSWLTPVVTVIASGGAACRAAIGLRGDELQR